MKNFHIEGKQKVHHWASQFFGLGLLVIIIVLAYDFISADYMRFMMPKIVFPWLITTFCGRFLMVEVFIRPIHALKRPIGRMAAFWLGWLRTFFNQIVPLSGITLIATYCKRRCGLDWGQIVALSSPLYLLCLATTGTFATIAILFNYSNLGQYAMPMTWASIAVTGLAMLTIIKGPSSLTFIPARIRTRLESMELALQVFASHRGLLLQLTFYHSGIILLRCLRLWLLFILGMNLTISVQDILLLAAISEFGFLLPLIPGGIGIREGAIVAAAWMLGLDIEVVAFVALMDRVFSIAVITLMAMPAYLVLRRLSYNL